MAVKAVAVAVAELGIQLPLGISHLALRSQVTWRLKGRMSERAGWVGVAANGSKRHLRGSHVPSDRLARVWGRCRSVIFELAAVGSS